MTVIHVVSTAFVGEDPRKRKLAELCKASVAAQLGVEVVHHFVDAATQEVPATKTENILATVRHLPADAVVAFVDGDDRLAHKKALLRVAEEHERGMWCTWGSFMDDDGRPGFAAKVDDDADYRRVPWVSTHLKTVRAGLLQRIHPADLQYRDDADVVHWIDRGDDPAFMWPCLEQAGKDRVAFIRDCLYVYSLSVAWHRSASPAERKHEVDLVAMVRARKPYDRLKCDRLEDMR